MWVARHLSLVLTFLLWPIRMNDTDFNHYGRMPLVNFGNLQDFLSTKTTIADAIETTLSQLIGGARTSQVMANWSKHHQRVE